VVIWVLNFNVTLALVFASTATTMPTLETLKEVALLDKIVKLTEPV